MANENRPRPFGVVRVSGPSMSPTLSNDDLVLVRYGARVRPGAVVVLRHPNRPDLLLIKRAVARRADGTWWILGDNPYNPTGDSTDYGAVPDDVVLATALLRVRARPDDRRSLRGRLAWAWSAVRPLRPDASASGRLRDGR